MKDKEPLMVRQGDVLLEKIDSIPVDAVRQRDKGRVVLAYGEVTGHAHAISTKYATRYEWQGNTLIAVKKGAVLKHEEHTHIPLEPGAWLKVQQKSYTPQEIRRVAD